MTRLNRPVILGAAGAVVVIVLAWWFLLWGPRNRSYNDANAAAQQAQTQVEQLQAQVTRLESIKQRIPALQAELAKLNVAVPAKAELDQIILDINGAADQSGVELLSISPSPPAATSATGGSAPSSAPSGTGSGATSSSAPPAIRVSLSLNGGYEQVLDFINRLDALPRLLVIDNLGLTSSASGPTAAASGAELTISMTVRLFTQTAQPTGSTTTTTKPGGTSGTTTTTVAGGGAGTTTTTTPTTGATTGTVPR